MDAPQAFPMVIFLVILFASVAFIGGGIYSYFQKTTVVQSTAGSQSAILYRLLSAPELSYINTKNATEKFLFDVRKLDRYKNRPVPGADFSGSYYFLEIRGPGDSLDAPPPLDPETGRKWRFTNAPNFDNYAYNTRLRGVRPVDEPAIDFCIPQGRKIMLSEFSGSDPFADVSEVNHPVPVNILEGENVLSATAYWLIDPDSSYDTGDYLVKYPLCICDLACPSENGCQCSKDCSGSDTVNEVGIGENCN